MSDKDTIYRRDAYNAVRRNTFRLTFAEEQSGEGHVAWSAEVVYSDVMEGALLELPPAQTERPKYIIQNFHDYQVEWLKSHCDIELEPELEMLIVRFLNDTANCYIMEIER